MSDTRGARREARGADEGRGSAFDRAIDGVVREMLDVEPPPGLRTRVLRRVSDSDQQVASGFSRKVLWTAVPLGAAALLILAVMLARQTPPAPVSTSVRGESPRPELTAPTLTPPAVTAPGRVGTVNTEDARRVARRAPSPAPARATERMVIASVAAAEGTIAIEPLEDVAPIQVAAIGPGAIAHREVVVTPLAPIAQLQIAPLTTPAGRF